jgi:hypothetical protein
MVDPTEGRNVGFLVGVNEIGFVVGCKLVGDLLDGLIVDIVLCFTVGNLEGNVFD